VLLGLNVKRQQWELPGGAGEPGESAQAHGAWTASPGVLFEPGARR